MLLNGSVHPIALSILTFYITRKVTLSRNTDFLMSSSDTKGAGKAYEVRIVVPVCTVVSLSGKLVMIEDLSDLADHGALSFLRWF